MTKSYRPATSAGAVSTVTKFDTAEEAWAWVDARAGYVWRMVVEVTEVPKPEPKDWVVVPSGSLRTETQAKALARERRWTAYKVVVDD